MLFKLALLLAFGAAAAAPAEQTPPPNAPPPPVVGVAPERPGCNKSSWYPPAAITAGEQGITFLSFHVATDGTTKDITVTTSSGYADLDAAAVAEAGCWRYKPGMKDGKPVEVTLQGRVIWRLIGGDSWLERLFQ